MALYLEAGSLLFAVLFCFFLWRWESVDGHKCI